MSLAFSALAGFMMAYASTKRKKCYSTSEMTYNVSGGALNSTHSLQRRANLLIGVHIFTNDDALDSF